MESIPRNIILDLLPAYIAGEASEETRDLVEKYAQHDPGIARLIRAEKLEPAILSPKSVVPEDLEMKSMKRVRRSIRLQMLYVAIATASILLVPLAAMIFTNEINWSLFDFIVMGVLLLTTGLTYVLISRVSDNIAYRTAVGVASAAGLLLIWVNLAVGIIGSENNPANFLYLGVFAVGFIGAGIVRLRARGMVRALFATALTQMLVPLAALIFWRPSLDEPPGPAGIFIVNAFFAILFVVSALLFRRAGQNERNP